MITLCLPRYVNFWNIEGGLGSLDEGRCVGKVPNVSDIVPKTTAAKTSVRAAEAYIPMARPRSGDGKVVGKINPVAFSSFFALKLLARGTCMLLMIAKVNLFRGYVKPATCSNHQRAATLLAAVYGWVMKQ